MTVESHATASPPRPNTRGAFLKLPFMEIAEVARGIDLMSPPIRATRLFIRYLTRTTGYRASALVLGALRTALRLTGNGRTVRYVRHLLSINTLRLEYVRALAAENLDRAVDAKIKWCDAVLRDSFSLRARWNAKAYLNLLAKHGYPVRARGAYPEPVPARTDRAFYIFGPNAADAPSPRYRDFTLVLTKPIDLDLTGFGDRLLFLNSVYYNRVVAKDFVLQEYLAATYGDVLVSCREATLRPPFTRALFPIGDSIAGPQALGRILFHLMRTYGTFRCVIEGFDLYIGTKAYSSYYPALARQANNAVSERSICISLADHDALYNFLYVKELVGRLELVDSPDFQRLVGLTGAEYLAALKAARNFTSIRRP